MEWVETTGPTVEAAKDAALDQLGVDEQDAEFEVLEEPKTGLFGRLRGEARVRARVRPATPRPKEERRRERRPRGGEGTERAGRASGGSGRGGGRGAGGRGGNGGGRGAGRGAGDKPTPSPAGVGGETRASGPEGATAVDPDETAPAARENGERAGQRAETTGPGRRRRRRGGRGRSGGGAGGGGGRPQQDGAAPGTEEASEGGLGMDVALEQQGEVAEDFLAGLVEAFGLRADISVAKLDEETLELSLDGEDLNILIGARGVTLQAIQDLARTVVQRQTGASHGRILVDVLGYRKKRRAALERFARQIADEVQASGTKRVLEPMSAADRKVVHDVINTIDGVQTTSEGEEPRRRVVVLPGGTGSGTTPAPAAAGDPGASGSGDGDSGDGGSGE